MAPPRGAGAAVRRPAAEGFRPGQRERLYRRRRRLLGDWRRRSFRRWQRGRLHRRRRRLLGDWRRSFRLRRRWRLYRRRGRLLGDRRRRSFRRWRRLLGGRRSCGRWRRRLYGSWRCVLSGWRRGLFGRLRLFGRRRGIFRGWSFRLNVDDHLSSRLEGLRPQRDEEKRSSVERKHDQDDKGPEPRRPDGRRLENAPVQTCDGHGAGAFGAAGVGALGAAGVGETVRRGPDTIAMREMPFAASSSITETTSP